MKQKRGAKFKCKVALEALKENRTLNEIAKDYGIHPIQVGRWKKELIEKSKDLFVDKRRKKKNQEQITEEASQRKIGQLTMEIEWLKKKLGI